jgi:hypothetical protein
MTAERSSATNRFSTRRLPRRVDPVARQSPKVQERAAAAFFAQRAALAKARAPSIINSPSTLPRLVIRRYRNSNLAEIQRTRAMTDKTAQIGKIVEVMLDTWDLPADCNEGELFTYAERLHDRIAAGDSQEKLYAYLSEVQVDKLDMAKSDAFRTIVDRAVELSRR